MDYFLESNSSVPRSSIGFSSLASDFAGEYAFASINSDQCLRITEPKLEKKTKANNKHPKPCDAKSEFNGTVYDYLDDLCNTVYLMEKKKAKLVKKAQEVDVLRTLEILAFDTMMKKVRLQATISQLESVIKESAKSSQDGEKVEENIIHEENIVETDDQGYKLKFVDPKIDIIHNTLDDISQDAAHQHSDNTIDILDGLGNMAAFRISTSDSEDTMRLCFLEIDENDYTLVVGDSTKDCNNYKVRNNSEADVKFNTLNLSEVSIHFDEFNAIPPMQKKLLEVLVDRTSMIMCNYTTISSLLATILFNLDISHRNRIAQFNSVKFILSLSQLERLLRSLPVKEVLFNECDEKTIAKLDDKIAQLLPPKSQIRMQKLTMCIGLTDATLRFWMKNVPAKLVMEKLSGTFSAEVVCKLIETALTGPNVVHKQFKWKLTLSSLIRTVVKSFIHSTFEYHLWDGIWTINNKANGRSMELLLVNLEYDMEVQAYHRDFSNFQFKQFRKGKHSSAFMKDFHVEHPQYYD